MRAELPELRGLRVVRWFLLGPPRVDPISKALQSPYEPAIL